MRTRQCELCGRLFEPRSAAQKYCNKDITKACIVCGKPFIARCNPDALSTCDNTDCKNKSGGYGSKTKIKTCVQCGRTFTPNSSRQKYCNLPITSSCANCGKEFTKSCNPNNASSCCSDQCKREYIHKQQVAGWSNTVRTCEVCGNLFTPANNTQKVCTDTHYNNCIICGSYYIIDTSANKSDRRSTCSEVCMKLLMSKNNGFRNNLEAHAKFAQTSLIKYGVPHPMQSDSISSKPLQTYQLRTGYSSPYANPEVRSKIAKKLKMSHSSLEKRIAQLLTQYNIEYEQHYMLSNGKVSHEFDFHLPRVKMLIDGDGLFFHSYLDDPNGKQVLDYYDEDRLALVPEGYHIHVIPEGCEEGEIKKLSEYLHEHANLDEYDTEIFKWCRSIEFPYPQYDEKRMRKDYTNLQKYSWEKYVPQARLGDSIIQHYHKSIYSARVGKYASPIDGWYDDELLKKVIQNRLIYMNDLNPSKVLRGFNISKLCPRVSVFNPVLAKYLTEKYLSEYDAVFDPFSGFSGRLLGVTAAGKKYIGQDLNSTAVSEANQIIDLLDLSGQVSNKDSLDCLSIDENIECILTCPPYAAKEIYADETVFKTCDEWIDFIVEHYHASRYVFVVDSTKTYTDNVAESVKSTSHINKVNELVVVIDRS